MIEEHDLVIAGVSGGADSVCLLHILWRLLKEIPYRLIVVHIDHGVREDSAEDAAYVESLCQDLKIPFYLKNVDMEGYAKEYGISSEEAGRQLRYAAFEEALYREELCTGEQKAGGYKIAVAHNADDRAETMLFHLFRGSGIKGLSSIQPVRERVVRPLLCLERAEIEQYLNRHGLDYCVDSTNGEDSYTRNKIRHHILPYAREEVCSRAVSHMGELADLLSETERYLEGQAGRLYDRYVEEIALDNSEPNSEAQGLPIQEQILEESVISGKQDKAAALHIQGARLLEEDPAMYKRVLLMCMERLTPYRKDITGRHIASLVELMAGEGCKELSLPYGIKAYKEYGRLILCRDIDKDVDSADNVRQAAAQYEIHPPMELFVFGEGTYTFILLENTDKIQGKQQNIPENRYTKWFDYDKITTTLLLRTRQQGDFLTIDSALHTKSVKKYMINEKIPKIQRDSMYILADGPHVVWIPGYRISERYKVDESTTRILQVRLRGGCHGGTN